MTQKRSVHHALAEKLPSQGFTLVELLVVLSITFIMLFVVLVNYLSFSEQKLLELLVNDIAQTAREAQTYSLSGREATANQFSDFGIYYTADADEIIFFADSDPDQNGEYDPPGPPPPDDDDVVVKRVLVTPPLSIQGVTDDTLQEIEEFTVLYKRPAIEPIIFARYAGSPPPSIEEVERVIITLAGPSGTKAIEIWSSGQIAVE